jgi:hypothetical protein
VEKIESLPATTLDGLRIKAQAVQAIYYDGVIEFGDDATADLRIAASVLRNLLAMSGGTSV